MKLGEVLSRPKFDKYVSREDRQHFLRLLGGVARLTSISQRISACRDPKDDRFLDAALNGEAQVIFSADQDLLALHPFHGIEIWRPADFLARALD